MKKISGRKPDTLVCGLAYGLATNQIVINNDNESLLITANEYPVFSSFWRGGPSQHFRRSEVVMAYSKVLINLKLGPYRKIICVLTPCCTVLTSFGPYSMMLELVNIFTYEPNFQLIRA